MKLTRDFFSSFCTSVASGSFILTFNEVSRIDVVTMKKKISMKIMSGIEPVDIAGTSFASSFLNFAILFFFYYLISLMVYSEKY